MDKCVFMDRCIFPRKKKLLMPSMLEFIRIKYCEGDNAACARHLLYRKNGAADVPDDLFPNDMERALEMSRPVNRETTRLGDPGACKEKL